MASLLLLPFTLILRLFYSFLTIFQLSFILGIFGFSIGLTLGLIAGYFIFIYNISAEVDQPNVDDLVKSVGDLSPNDVKRMLPELPVWVKNPDFDRVDWLNTFLSELWPYVNKAVSAEVVKQVTPLLLQYKPAQIESLGFETFNLGTFPITLGGIKVYDTTDDEMIIEPTIKWAGNPNIIVAAKAYGVKATVQLIDLLVFATVRVTLKPLVPVFPCFSKIAISLMNKPKIDFGLKVVGADLMSIPGLYNFVQKTAKDVISGILIWPHEMQVYNTDIGSQPPIGRLLITNLKCSKLKNLDMISKSDPYVTMSVGDKIGNVTTPVKSNNLDPSWTEEFHLIVRDLKTQELQINVFDNERNGKDILMGVQSVVLNSLEEGLEEGKVKPVSLTLYKNKVQLQQSMAKDKENNKASLPVLKTTGQIHFDLRFVKFEEEDIKSLEGGKGINEDENEKFDEDVGKDGGKLKVIIHSAENLETKSSHAPSAYVKVRFRSDEKKTKVVKKQNNPEFDEVPFEFYVHDHPPMEDILHIHVYNKSSSHFYSGKDVIGYVDIPLIDVVRNHRINEIYQLTDSKNGKLKVELVWIQKKKAEEKQEGTANGSPK